MPGATRAIFPSVTAMSALSGSSRSWRTTRTLRDDQVVGHSVPPGCWVRTGRAGGLGEPAQRREYGGDVIGRVETQHALLQLPGGLVIEPAGDVVGELRGQLGVGQRLAAGRRD